MITGVRRERQTEPLVSFECGCCKCVMMPSSCPSLSLTPTPSPSWSRPKHRRRHWESFW